MANVKLKDASGVEITYNNVDTVTIPNSVSGNSTFVNADGDNAIASDILSGKTAHTSTGAITGTMSNNGAVSSTISTQGGTYTIPVGYHNGSGIITASLPQYQGDLYVPPLNDCTWTEIGQFAAQGSSYWSVGDAKTGTYINNESQSYRIVQFNHSGDAGNITFEQVNLMNNTYAMKSSMTSSDSWANSDLKTTINNFAIDSTLSAVIKTASKPCATSVSDETQTSVSSKLWVMSEKEMFNTTSYSKCTTEGSQYTYYANGGSKVKTKSGSASPYWLRSACEWLGYGSVFAYVSDYGSVYDGDADYTLGVAPCFCI